LVLLVNKGVNFSYQYPSSAAKFYQPFFPSLSLSEKFNDMHELQFNATRKISRPGLGQLNPNVEVVDKFDYEQGNPELQPEFSNQGELNYLLNSAPLNWLSSVYGRYTQQPITSYSYDSSNILIMTSINGKGKFTYGWENTMRISAVKNLNILLDGNIFYTSIQASPAANVIVSNSGISWFAKATIGYKFPLGFSAQANGSYEAPKIVPQGKTVPFYYFDLSASKDFGIATLNFGLSDVLNSKRNGYVYSTPDFVQSLTKRREVRYAKLGVVFKFGKEDASMLKQKKQKKEKQNTNEDNGD
jgi:outer membrane receptor protein involved in Fe transport